ncbi:MAG: hypothetical protein P1U80_03760 [Pseudomonadales bacterium]|nr:hypothetical protein [Pseudomonadales bacterium]
MKILVTLFFALYSSSMLAAVSAEYYCTKQKGCRAGDIIIIEANKIGVGKTYLTEKAAKYCDFSQSIFRDELDDRNFKVACVYMGEARKDRKTVKGSATD